MRKFTMRDGRVQKSRRRISAAAGGVHLVDGMIDLNGSIAEVWSRVSRRAAVHADDTTDTDPRTNNEPARIHRLT